MTTCTKSTAHRSTLGAVLVFALAACDSSLPSPTAASIDQQVSPSAASLISANVVPGVSPGAFFNAITANNSGRATTEFWDAISADDNASNACNIGFYASGTLAADCINAAAGSNANQGGMSRYWGDGAQNRDAAAFTFGGSNSYTVTLAGSYAGGNSEVGWFTKSGAGYTFNAVAAWTGKTVNSSVVINTGGLPWGFYIRNSINPETGGCQPPDTNCSDAEGGFDAAQFQQFSLFTNSNKTRYLVGAEDNKLELLPNGFYRDSDYNDYIWSVVPAQIGGQGCSPGYWKTHTAWPTPYMPSTQFSAVFENAFPGKTFQDVLSLGGGGLNALGRHTVSALLNAQQLGIDFDLSAASVIGQFNAAYPGSNGAYTTLKNTFETLTDVDGRICPLN
jgi:hypothetical protein